MLIWYRTLKTELNIDCFIVLDYKTKAEVVGLFPVYNDLI